jgi:transcriptional regulator with XRE-family HTH domain
MPSFRTALTPPKRTAARFVTGVRRTLLKALADENKRTGITQTSIAQSLGVHRSVISRELRGSGNLTLGKVAELASAMGFEPYFDLRRPSKRIGQNIESPVPRPSAPPQSNADSINRLLLPEAA